MDINERSLWSQILENNDNKKQEIKITTLIPGFVKLRSQATYNKFQIEDIGIDRLREIAKRNLAGRLVKDIIDNVEIKEVELNEENKIMFSMNLEVLTEKRELNRSNKKEILNLIEKMRENPHSFNTAAAAAIIIRKIENDEILIG